MLFTIIPTAVALFAQDTHNPSFIGSARTEAKDWIGGQVFTRQQDLIDYFKTIAVESNGPPASTGLPPCDTFDKCTYDVTNPLLTHEIVAKTLLGISPDETPRWG